MEPSWHLPDRYQNQILYQPYPLLPNSFVFLASIEEGLPNIHCCISKELVAEKGLNAGTIIRELGKLIDGNGGGQPFFASGKGKNVGGIPAALENVKKFI